VRRNFYNVKKGTITNLLCLWISHWLTATKLGQQAAANDDFQIRCICTGRRWVFVRQVR